MTKDAPAPTQRFEALVSRLPPEGVARTFPDEAACEARLREVVWPDGPRCPRCGGVDVRPLPKGEKLHCRACRVQFSLKSVTLFHGSRLSFRWWFLAAEHLLSAHARNRADVLLTEERFAADRGVARMTARKALALIAKDLAREEGGELGKLICSLDLPSNKDRS